MLYNSPVITNEIPFLLSPYLAQRDLDHPSSLSEIERSMNDLRNNKAANLQTRWLPNSLQAARSFHPDIEDGKRSVRLQSYSNHGVVRIVRTIAGSRYSTLRGRFSQESCWTDSRPSSLDFSLSLRRVSERHGTPRTWYSHWDSCKRKKLNYRGNCTLSSCLNMVSRDMLWQIMRRLARP